ncbi:MAG: arginase [Planctomycetota bacterium]|nr:MAG: arginase [Planctomycetota bacterium]
MSAAVPSASNGARRVCLLGVPMDLGGGRRGVDMGPSALRIAGVEDAVRALGHEFEDLGNVGVSAPESRQVADPRARFLPEIARCCRRLRARVERVLDAGGFPLVVGGDHSIACGTVGGIASWHQRRGQRIGLIWFDAHGDFNTPDSSPTGNVHGMPLASCLGFGPDELTRLADVFPMVEAKNAVLVGIHQLDAGERALIREAGIKAYTMRDIDMLGIHRVMREAIEIASDGTAGFHLSYDMDGCDPGIAPGVGTPVPGGASYRESHLVMEHAAESGRLLGLEITEINPILDVANRTAAFAVELVGSALGKQIL